MDILSGPVPSRRFVSPHDPLVYRAGQPIAGPPPSNTATSFPVSTPPIMQHHTGGFGGEDWVQRGYSVRAQKDTEYHKYLESGDFMFVTRTRVRDTQARLSHDPPAHFFSLGQVNQTLRKLCHDALVYIKDLANKTHILAQPTPMAVQLYRNGTELDFVHYYETQGGIADEQEYRHMHYLTAYGIERRFNYLGANAQQANRKGWLSAASDDTLINVVYGGGPRVRNVFGNAAVQGKPLFFLLKRPYYKDGKFEDFFAYVPYVMEKREIAPSDLYYPSLCAEGAYRESACVHFAGTMGDQIGNVHSETARRVTAGLEKASGHEMKGAAEQLPWATVITDVRYAQRFYYAT